MTPSVSPSPPFVARTSRDVVSVVGPDAAAYLQGQLSQDVAALSVGASAAAFVLAPQGKVDGWGRVLRRADDAFEIDVDAGAGSVWEARLRRFLLRTRAEISVEEQVATLAIRGIEAAALAEVEGALVPLAPWLVGADVLRVADGALPSGLPDGIATADVEAVEALRIRAGIPAWGSELDVDTIPASLGQWAIDASVSFGKGCYTGQELVARIDSRGGHVPRRLVGLIVAGPPPTAGAPVVVADAEVAAITSSAADDERGSVALAFLPRSVEIEAAGTAAAVGGVTATLHPLPLA